MRLYQLDDRRVVCPLREIRPVNWRLGFAIAFVLACGPFFVGCAAHREGFAVYYPSKAIQVESVSQAEVNDACKHIKEDDRGNPLPPGTDFRGCFAPTSGLLDRIFIGPLADACTVLHEFLHADRNLTRKEVAEAMKGCREE